MCLKVIDGDHCVSRRSWNLSSEKGNGEKEISKETRETIKNVLFISISLPSVFLFPLFHSIPPSSSFYLSLSFTSRIHLFFFFAETLFFLLPSSLPLLSLSLPQPPPFLLFANLVLVSSSIHFSFQSSFFILFLISVCPPFHLSFLLLLLLHTWCISG